MTADQSRAVIGTEKELQAEVSRLRETVRVLADGLETTTRTLTDSEARWRCLAKQSLTGIAIAEGNRFISVNPLFAQIFGYQGDEMLAVPVIETVAHSSRLRVIEHLRACPAGEPHPLVLEFEGLRKDGSSVYLELSSSPYEMSGRLHAVLMVSDISARKLAERKAHALDRRLAELAVRDPLTGLYSRRFTEASLERDLMQCDRDNTPLCVVFGDIDDFKAINQVLGRREGDEVLKAFGSLLKRRCRKSDMACRYGGDEFLMVFPGMPAEAAVRWAGRIRVTMPSARLAPESSGLQVSASFGVAAYPLHGDSWQELIAAADTAQAAAKATAESRVVCAALKAEAKGPDLALLLAREF